MLDDALTLWDLVARRAELTPDRVMLVDGEDETTFAEYRERAERAAAGLAELGVGEGTAVSWQLPTWTESAVLVAALARLGAVQNPMLPIYRKREVGFIAAETQARLLVCPSTWKGFDYEALAREVAAENPGLDVLVSDRKLPDGDPSTLPARAPTPADAAALPVRFVFYTSGTTANPKGAQHTERTVMEGALGYARRAEVGEDDTALVAFPFTHIGGIIIGVFTPLLTGQRSVLMEAWTAADSTALIRRHGVTLGNGAPAIHQALLEEARQDPEAYRTIRAFPSGGSTKPPQLHYDLKEAVPSCVGIVSGYGLTECPILANASVRDPDESLAGSEGRPVPGVEIRLVDLDGKDVTDEAGAEGEVWVRGPMLSRGYVDAALDADAFVDGWFRTGDLARLDSIGSIVITGRIKDIIIRKGENISAKEIEDLLYGHPAVADVAVLGLPDPASGERACAVVVLKEGAEPLTMAALREFLEGAGLMRQKLPEQLELVDALPRNPSGKVMKHELRARYADAG